MSSSDSPVARRARRTSEMVRASGRGWPLRAPRASRPTRGTASAPPRRDRTPRSARAPRRNPRACRTPGRSSVPSARAITSRSPPLARYSRRRVEVGQEIAQEVRGARDAGRVPVVSGPSTTTSPSLVSRMTPGEGTAVNLTAAVLTANLRRRWRPPQPDEVRMSAAASSASDTRGRHGRERMCESAATRLSERSRCCERVSARAAHGTFYTARCPVRASCG